MRCPACNAENPEGAVTCASCGAALGEAAAAVTAPAQPEPAATPRGRRLSKLAVFALIAAGVAPWLQVLAMESGGEVLGKLVADNWMALMALEYGAYALFLAAIVTSLVALSQVLGRRRLRGGALAVGGLLVAVAGMAGGIYGPALAGDTGALVSSMGGGTGHYLWQRTVIILALAVVCEIVLAFVRTSAPAPAPEQTEPEPAKTA